jgi:hypothetical protein
MLRRAARLTKLRMAMVDPGLLRLDYSYSQSDPLLSGHNPCVVAEPREMLPAKLRRAVSLTARVRGLIGSFAQV